MNHGNEQRAPRPRLPVRPMRQANPKDVAILQEALDKFNNHEFVSKRHCLKCGAEYYRRYRGGVR